MLSSDINILSTRILDDVFIKKANEAGISIDISSFIETQPITSEEIINKTHTFQQKNITAVFTSINAIEAIQMQLTKQPHWKIYCLGGLTKMKAYEVFGQENILATAKNASLLAERIVDAKPADEIIFFCGDHRLDELPETLKAHGINIQEEIVYNTIQTPQQIEKDYKGMLFFSPSAAHSFFSINTATVDVVMFAIGKTTAAAIQSYCSNKIIVNEWPGKEQMIDLVIHYFKEEKNYVPNAGA